MLYPASALRRLIHDEEGGEVLEYALVSGLIVAVAIIVITHTGTRLLKKWNTLNKKM